MPQLPVNIVGSSVFGRYPKISIESTTNMFISDNWLVPTYGFTKVETLNADRTGRGMFNSTRLGKLVVVVGSQVFTYDKNGYTNEIGTLDTSTGNVFIDENAVKQIAICDKRNIYIYDYDAATFSKVDTYFTPGYVVFQDGYFIAPDIENPSWNLSALNNGFIWLGGSQNVGRFQTKPDNTVAIVKIPGKGNVILVMGNIVTEMWTDVGASLFPYQRQSAFNIDYGCANPASIGTGDGFIAWVGINERSNAAIMYSTGGAPTQISSDGINYLLETLVSPRECSGFIFKQDGHTFYQVTFKNDNLTLLYDFTTQKFFNMTDHQMNYHPIGSVAYFNNDYYGLSFNDGNLYKIGSDITTFNDREIPRVRVCQTLRTADGSPFIASKLNFIIEGGVNETISRVDMSISKNGGENFGSYLNMELTPLGNFRNRAQFWRLGYCNEITPQFRFWGKGRFVVYNGVMDITK